MQNRAREGFPLDNFFAESQGYYLSRIENHLFYNQRCEPQTLFNLYRQIWQQGAIIATGSKAEHELLKSGLVIMHQHQLRLAPTLDRQSFNDSWVDNQLMRLQPYSKIKLKLFNLEIKASRPYTVLAEIKYWTGGNPFLTQKICQIICQHQNFIPSNQEATQISQLVHQHIIDNWSQGSAASHLLELRSRLFAYSGSLKALLIAYQEIWHGQAIDYRSTPEQAYLLTIGLIKLDQDQVLIANPIYYQIFDHLWSRQQLAQISQANNNFRHHNYLDLTLESARDEVNSNFSRLVKAAVCLIFMGGIAGIGVNLKVKYAQWQQLQEQEQAHDLLAQHKYTAAIAAYDQLLQTNPKQPHLLWINRGYAWLGLQQYERMRQSCTTAISLELQTSLGWNCQGEALYYLKKNQQALQAFNKAIAIDPDNATFWLNRSSVLSELQQFRQALTASIQGSELLLKSPLPNSEVKSQLALAFNQQGQSWLQLERNQQALITFQRALEYVPDYLPAIQGAGIASYQLGRYPAAINLFTQALQQDNLAPEEQAINWLYQGISLCATQHLDRASQAFEQVLQLTTNPQYQKLAQAGCGIQ